MNRPTDRQGFSSPIAVNSYDIYHQWLGIPAAQQPPSLYRLLGVVEFEQDPEVIRNAAERQAMHVRRLARGEFTDAGQELLNEIAAAKLSLINDVKRAAYDQSLRQRNGTPSPPLPPQDRPDETTAPDAPQSLRLCEAEATRVDLSLAPGIEGSFPTWIIGYHPDCDVRIEGDTISGIHCQLLHDEGNLYLSDLKSTNGTYVNQEKIHATRRIHPTDLVTLGRHHRLLLPAGLMSTDPGGDVRAIFIGRGPGNEWRLNDPGVSFFHARLLLKAGSVMVEDLNSRQGIRLARHGKAPVRVTRSSLRPDDVLWLSGVQLPVREVFQWMDGS